LEGNRFSILGAMLTEFMYSTRVQALTLIYVHWTTFVLKTFSVETKVVRE